MAAVATQTLTLGPARARAATLPGIALTLFLGAFLLDPGGGLGLKYATVVLAVAAIAVSRLGTVLPRRFLLIEFPLFFAVPFALLWASLAVFHVPLGDSLSRVTPCATFLILPLLTAMPAKAQDVVFRRTMIAAAVLMIAGFIALYGMIFAGNFQLIASISAWMDARQIGFFGLRPEFVKQGLSIPNVYFRWAMLLIAGLIVCGPGRRRDLVLLGTAAVLSLSTGVIVFGFGGLALYAGARLLVTRRISVTAAIFTVLILVAVLLAVPFVADIALTALDKLTVSNESTSIKFGHMQSVIDEIGRRPDMLLWGMGLGSSFYSMGVSQFVNLIEVGQFDMIRQFGLVYFLAFTAYIAWLTVANWRVGAAGQRWAIALVMIYFAAATNPLLYSPLYFLVMAFARARLISRTLPVLVASGARG